MSKDLQEERDRIDFKQTYLSEVLWGGKADLEAYKSSQKEIDDDEILRNKFEYYDMTREETMIDHMKKANRAFVLNREKYYFNKKTTSYYSWHYALLGLNTVGLHYSMFQMAVLNLSSKEQRAKWEPLIQ